MDMPPDDDFDRRVGGDDGQQFSRVLQHHFVHPRAAARERVVVQGEQDMLSRMSFQRDAQELQFGAGQAAGGAAGEIGVQQDDGPGAVVAVAEAQHLVRMNGAALHGRAHHRRVVVVAGQAADRGCQSAQQIGQQAVGSRVRVGGQVAGQQDQVRGRLLPLDVIERRPQGATRRRFIRARGRVCVRRRRRFIRACRSDMRVAYLYNADRLRVFGDDVHCHDQQNIKSYRSSI